MDINEYPCKSILTRTSGYLKQVCSHSLNPYVGCGFGKSACGVGCYVQFNQWLTKGRQWGGFVDVKTNAAEVYTKTCDAERRWANRRSVPFAIFFSSSTDPWQPLEKKYRVTRKVLTAMIKHPPEQLVLQTHSTLIRDDILLIKKLSGLCGLRVHISVEGDIESLPGLPPPPSKLADRVRLLAEFSSEGIKTVACMSPLYPLKDPEKFFARLEQTGVSAVVIDHFVEGDGTANGSRTHKTLLPQAMAEVEAESPKLSYRDNIAAIAKNYLPVGISSAGFAGNFSQS